MNGHDDAALRAARDAARPFAADIAERVVRAPDGRRAAEIIGAGLAEAVGAALDAARPHHEAAEREQLAGTADRETLGMLVREVWTVWASEQSDPKPSWLTPWEDLDDGQREVDMRIGVLLAGIGAAAERERIYAELGNDHFVIFTEDRWTIEHSVECRLSGHMHECSEHEAIALTAREYDPGMAGRWRITGIDGEGMPMLERADSTGRQP